jgi:hypothetical protein
VSGLDRGVLENAFERRTEVLEVAIEDEPEERFDEARRSVGCP